MVPRSPELDKKDVGWIRALCIEFMEYSSGVVDEKGMCCVWILCANPDEDLSVPSEAWQEALAASKKQADEFKAKLVAAVKKGKGLANDKSGLVKEMETQREALTSSEAAAEALRKELADNAAARSALQDQVPPESVVTKGVCVVFETLQLR